MDTTARLLSCNTGQFVYLLPLNIFSCIFHCSYVLASLLKPRLQWIWFWPSFFSLEFAGRYPFIALFPLPLLLICVSALVHVLACRTSSILSVQAQLRTLHVQKVFFNPMQCTSVRLATSICHLLYFPARITCLLLYFSLVYHCIQSFAYLCFLFNLLLYLQ
ncbi:hypothetical protein L228DRAFT_27478 [Xylona heveae TC161]|uniref:Uncharacterized protein n=1 Tax=Xylona heveae (strain CBS 132557 / TC161) TaxID=1328760 RepID=A0A165AG88_XYLHT|nr:hypothetical protein L228DRAFT_27478 [Xylona heveae TC161]KZF20425.1 hypothetical protein L228DRAFT_27478 [Xylona heveae TC161]